MTLAERPIWCAARALRALAPLVRILHAATRGTQECEKYGAVKQCVIFEVTERSVAPEEAVRTFVAFEKQVLVRTPCTCALFCNATLAPSTGERSEGISRSRGSFFRWSENLVRVL